MKKQTTFKVLGDLEIKYISEVENGVYYDTEVRINEGDPLCVIAGNTLSEFHEKLEEIVNKYRI